MDAKIAALTEYFSTNGTLSEAVAFAQLVANDAFGQISKLYNLMAGVI